LARSLLFPYTTLFRSSFGRDPGHIVGARVHPAELARAKADRAAHLLGQFAGDVILLRGHMSDRRLDQRDTVVQRPRGPAFLRGRSEEHTSELQSREKL